MGGAGKVANAPQLESRNFKFEYLSFDDFFIFCCRDVFIFLIQHLAQTFRRRYDVSRGRAVWYFVVVNKTCGEFGHVINSKFI